MACLLAMLPACATQEGSTLPGARGAIVFALHAHRRTAPAARFRVLLSRLKPCAHPGRRLNASQRSKVQQGGFLVLLVLMRSRPGQRLPLYRRLVKSNAIEAACRNVAAHMGALWLPTTICGCRSPRPLLFTLCSKFWWPLGQELAGQRHRAGDRQHAHVCAGLRR